MRRYRSEDNQRWVGFQHRPGDIVISTRTKCGTTWMQMICALLVFQDPELPAPLAQLSPWLDWPVEPLAIVRDRLAAQSHRRIIKTHTPLDGLPLDRTVTYLVVGRQPLDVAESMHHHRANLDQDRMAQLTGRALAAPAPAIAGPSAEVARWIDPPHPVDTQLDTLPGLAHHIADAWSRRAKANVVLIHFQDLIDDLEGQMRALAARLDIDVAPERWTALVEAARFDAMRASAERTVPDHLGVIRDRQAFFRSGLPGEGRRVLHPDLVDRYQERLGDLLPAEIATWLDPDATAAITRRAGS